MLRCLSSRPAIHLLPLLIALMAVSAASSASAATFTVNPTNISLSDSVTSRVLTVRNESQQPLRFQLTIMMWNQAPNGEMELAPTKDVAVFPPVLSLGVGESRSVRIGLIGKKAAAHELSYRVFVEELPPVGGPSQAGVTMLTRVSVPIFVVPGAARASASINRVDAAEGQFSFEVRNDGNVHFVPQNVRARVVSPDGKVLAEPELNAWYILAAGRRRFEIDLREFATDVHVEVEMLVNGTKIASRWSGR